MNKKSLSERDICTKFITPSIVAAGWDVDTQIREEVGFTDGRIYVRGKIHTRRSKKGTERKGLELLLRFLIFVKIQKRSILHLFWIGCFIIFHLKKKRTSAYFVCIFLHIFAGSSEGNMTVAALLSWRLQLAWRLL